MRLKEKLELIRMIKRMIMEIILMVVVVGGLIGLNMLRQKMIKDFFENMKKKEKKV